jgi:hypothetical protein
MVFRLPVAGGSDAMAAGALLERTEFINVPVEILAALWEGLTERSATRHKIRKVVLICRAYMMYIQLFPSLLNPFPSLLIQVSFNDLRLLSLLGTFPRRVT